MTYRNRNPKLSWIKSFFDIIKKGGDDDFGQSITIPHQQGSRRRRSMAPTSGLRSSLLNEEAGGSLSRTRRFSLPNSPSLALLGQNHGQGVGEQYTHGVSLDVYGSLHENKRKRLIFSSESCPKYSEEQ